MFLQNKLCSKTWSQFDWYVVPLSFQVICNDFKYWGKWDPFCECFPCDGLVQERRNSIANAL